MSRVVLQKLGMSSNPMIFDEFAVLIRFREIQYTKKCVSRVGVNYRLKESGLDALSFCLPVCLKQR